MGPASAASPGGVVSRWARPRYRTRRPGAVQRHRRAQARMNRRLTTSRLPRRHDERMNGIHDTRAATAAAAPQSRAGTRRWIGGLLLAEAVTFGVASYLHLQGHIPLGFTTITGESFPDAAIPEAIIGGVLAVGALLVLAAPGRARWAAVGVTGFAILGTAIGLAAVIGRSAGSAADIGYHAAIMAALLGTFTAALLSRQRRVSGSVPGS